MPTPESAAFLAKKPTVPPTYEGVDFEDNIAVHNARDAIIREQWVRSMMSRLVGEELGKCYAREGVNHLEKCGVLRGELSPDTNWSYCCRETIAQPLAEIFQWSRVALKALLTLPAEKYFELINERKIKGYLFQEKNYFASEGNKSA